MFGEVVQATTDDEVDDEDDEDVEPEDDFNAAWEVLDLARAIYDKQNEDDDEEVKLKLADTYIALGDVSLETGSWSTFPVVSGGAFMYYSTEKFEQAITDYEAALALKSDLLPVSSRQIAEAHYKLSMVLDLTSGRLADAIIHAEKALESVETRSAELRDGLNGQLKAIPQEQAKSVKGKSTGARLVRDDLVQNMSKSQIEVEIKELDGLKNDLALKVFQYVIVQSAV
jgi:HAT1-interacting factor 1